MRKTIMTFSSVWKHLQHSMRKLAFSYVDHRFQSEGEVSCRCKFAGFVRCTEELGVRVSWVEWKTLDRLL